MLYRIERITDRTGPAETGRTDATHSGLGGRERCWRPKWDTLCGWPT